MKGVNQESGVSSIDRFRPVHREKGETTDLPSFESGAVGRNAYETLRWRKFEPTAGNRRVMAGHSMCC